MLITRRRMLITGAASLAIPAIATSGEYADQIPSYDEVKNGDYFGDYNYMHGKYHDVYQRIFGTNMRCACGAGDCRVTKWRHSKLASPKGFDVVVNRQWVPLSDQTSIPKEGTVPEVLTHDWAHICAYDADRMPYGVNLPCAIINEMAG